ncbi:MAG: hypothetical protein MSC30_04625 [Gaiellaceae bacterium MAG52_C11]|nr:hypothetical protein [Candidatus Gaiellasilicea maunaloa]
MRAGGGPRALWIGGGTGAGKSTVTRILAGRLGVRAYHIDSFTWVHAARRTPAQERFLARSLDERWVDAEPAQMVDWFVEISRERLALVEEDLAKLPAQPPVLVEGPQVLPELLPASAAAVFLFSTAEFRRRAIGTRPFTLPVSDPERARENRLARDTLLAERIRAAAALRGDRVIDIEPAGDADAVAEIVAAQIPEHPLLGEAERAAVRRWENDATATQLRLWLASGEGPRELTSYPFACECGRLGCSDRVELAVEAFTELAARDGRVLSDSAGVTSSGGHV